MAGIDHRRHRSRCRLYTLAHDKTFDRSLMIIIMILIIIIMAFGFLKRNGMLCTVNRTCVGPWDFSSVREQPYDLALMA